MDDLFADSRPIATRERSYSGGYMAAGKAAEEAVLSWLQQAPWVVGIEDLRSLRVMREADVDCSVTLIDGRVTLAEIKSDRHLGKSGNFLFETLRINHTAPPEKAMVLGWSARSPARQLLYYAPSFRAVHSILMDEFRRAMQGYTEESRRKTRFDYVETDTIKSTVNILIPDRFVRAMPSYKQYSIGGYDGETCEKGNRDIEGACNSNAG